MRPRRMRISRIYRHLTRREPNRNAQWQQISLLRPHGSPGHLARAPGQKAYVPKQPPTFSFAPEEAAAQFEPFAPVDERERCRCEGAGEEINGGIIAALATSLFLLGCAYAAFAGYVLSLNSSFAYLGVLGSVISLLAAGIGICLAASSAYGRFSGKFLSVSVISMATLYGLLLCAGLAR